MKFLSMRRNRNLDLNYLKFVELSNKVFKEFSKPEIIWSPLLSISKPAPEILKKRQRIIYAVSTQRNLIYFLIIIPRIFLYLAIPLIHHLFHLRSFRTFNQKKFCKTKFIFLSHFIGQDLATSKDLYFGNLPDTVERAPYQNIILYLNHIKNTSSKRSSISKLLDPMCTKLILPKTTSTEEFLNNYFENIRNFFTVISALAHKNQREKGERIMITELALLQLSMESFMQATLLKNLLRVVKKTSAKNLMLTYEGHSYEIYILSQLQSFSLQLNVAVYQFAPIVPAQYSFFRNLDYLGGDIKVYVSGPLIKTIIAEKTQLSQNQVIVLGSGKNQKNSQEPIPKKHIKILLAAEGSKVSLSTFIDLAHDLALDHPDIFFIVRAHPASNKYKSNLFAKIGKKTTNLNLSDNTLEQDLQQASYCIYRSSSVGLEGLAYGVRPIHFFSGASSGLDPIELIDLPHPQYNTAWALKQEIINILENHKELGEKQRAEYLKLFSEYYAPLSAEVLK